MGFLKKYPRAFKVLKYKFLCLLGSIVTLLHLKVVYDIFFKKVKTKGTTPTLQHIYHSYFQCCRIVTKGGLCARLLYLQVLVAFSAYKDTFYLPSRSLSTKVGLSPVQNEGHDFLLMHSAFPIGAQRNLSLTGEETKEMHSGTLQERR